METSNSTTRVAVLASPGMGHLIPILELANRLLTLHNVHVTIFLISTDTSTSQTQLLLSSNLPSSPACLKIIDISPVNTSDLLSSTRKVETNISIIIRASLPALRSEISRMVPPPAALIVDLFGTDAFDIADQFALPKYMFITSTALFLALTTYVPILHQEIQGEYVDLPEPVRVPGCRPIRVVDLVDPMMDRNNEWYTVYLDMALKLPMADGLLLNTWDDLEPHTLRALREDKILLRQINRTPIYPIGPLVRTVGEISNSECECISWLDNQPSESVLYVSFGSGGTLSLEQVTELAWGLELSQQRFIWVIRPPPQTKKDVSSAFFSTGTGSGSGLDDPSPSDYLPDGFLTRTHGMGLVAPMWAPQVNILSHPSTGGFLSHCGWNSTLESIINGHGGVPMIAWPLYAEQRMNASMLKEDLGVAVQPEMLPTKGVVGREEIERMVRLVMDSEEGMRMKARIKELKHGALKALDKSGSSYNALSQVVKEWDSIHLQCKKGM